MLGFGRVWDIVCAPFQWISQMPFALQWGLLTFGLAMTHFTKRNQKGLVFSVSVAATALLAVAWVNSRVPLTAPLLGMLGKMPLWGSLTAVAASAIGFGAVTALAASFAQIKLNRYVTLVAEYGHYKFVPHIDEARVQQRCGLGGVFFWAVEAGMLLGLSRFPHSLRPVLPQAFIQPPLSLLLHGKVSAEVLCAAIAVAGAGGIVAALFRPHLRKRNTKISVTIYTLRMTVYLVMIVFASVSGALHLAVACAVSLALAARFSRMGYCRPEDCVPRFWFALEERCCLLCGFLEAAAIRSQQRTVVSLSEIGTLRCAHTLGARSDSLFLRGGLSRDALWHMRFGEGNTIVVCANCRKVFFAEDFTDTCPLCASHDKLWFSHPAALLMRTRTTLPGGAIVERAYETAVLQCAEDWQMPRLDNPSFVERSAWLLLPAAMYVLILLTCV